MCVAARRAGAPVKWVEDRQENLASGFQGHEQRFHVKAGFDADGRILGVARRHPAATSARTRRTRSRAGSSRSWRRPSCSGPTRCAATGRAPARSRATRRRWRRTAASRARRWCSRWSACCRRRRSSSTSTRSRSAGATSSRPTPSRGPARPASSSTAAATTRRSRRARTRSTSTRSASASAPRATRGGCSALGIICFAERTGYGTEAFNQRKMVVTPGYDSALARMDPSGGVTVYVGTSGHGQGHLTTLAQVAADRLSLDPERRRGPPERHRRDAVRVGHVRQPLGGRRRRRDAPRDGALAERLRRLAAHLLEAAPEDVELRDGRAQVKGSADRGLALRRPRAASPTSRRRSCPRARSPASRSTPRSTRRGTFSNATHGVHRRGRSRHRRGDASSATSSPRTAA